MRVLLNRVLKYLNWVVGVLLVLAIASIYWFAYRVLPRTTGEVKAPVRRSARVVRDSLGVPHIAGETLEDVLFVQGYATAQDRLWQMDALRRAAGGTLSEVVGPAALPADRESRRLRVRRVAEQHYRRLDPNVRALLAEYARGVNCFIETHRGALPLDFTLLGYDPEPWSVVDTILVGMYMFRDLTTSWPDEVQKRTMLAAGGNPKFVETLFAMRGGLEVSPGSNAWAVSGKFTASGNPILANDTHLQFTMPSTWYMVHLHAPQFDVSGVTLAGVPGVIIGHNQHIAWGVTNLHADVQDLYVERMDARTGEYVFKGQMLRAAAERELIPVKGARPVEFRNWVTQHGPLWEPAGQPNVTLRWVAAEPDGFDFPFLDLNAATNWGEFVAALRKFPGPGQNFVYADVDGNIGYHAAGHVPIRRSYRGDVPVDGSSGNFEWDGFIPFDELPFAYNPPGGMIVTANQNPFPPDYKYPINGSFAPYYRSAQITNLLRARTGWKPEDMIAVEKDVYSPLLRFVAVQAVKAYDARGRGNQQLQAPAEILRNWNGQMEKGTAAPMIAAIIYDHLRLAIAERAAPGKGMLYETTLAGPAVEHLLRSRPAEWFADWDAVLMKAFVEALDDGRQRQGSNPAKWDYGRYLELELKNPIIGMIPYLGKYFNIGPVPMSGSSSSVKQTTRRVGPSMRFVASVGDWERSLLNITVGESGQVLSRHYKDQWNAYYGAQSFPMRFANVSGDELKFVPDSR